MLLVYFSIKFLRGELEREQEPLKLKTSIRAYQNTNTDCTCHLEWGEGEDLNRYDGAPTDVYPKGAASPGSPKAEEKKADQVRRKRNLLFF